MPNSSPESTDAHHSANGLSAVGDEPADLHTKRFGTGAAIAWFSVLYAPVSFALAYRRELWNDELFTWYVCTQSGISGIWSALVAAADQNPPLFYWLTQLAIQLPGSDKLLLRLPELAAFWLLGICLVAIVSRHFPPAFGLVAALLAAQSGGHPYAYEARPYALVLGFGALALTCWQRMAADDRSRWTLGFALSLGAAVSMHYYAVLLVLPFCIAELALYAMERRVRTWVWLALAVGALPLLMYLPLIQANRRFASVFWGRPSMASLQESLLFVISSAIVPICILALWAAAQALVSRRGLEQAHRRTTIPIREFICVAGFIAIPLAAVMVARLFTGAYTHRYAIPGLIGICVLIAWCFGHATRGKTRAAVGAAVCITVYFALWHAYLFRWSGTNDHGETVRWLQQRIPAGSRVALLEPHTFMEISHQRPELGEQVFYIADPELALRYIGTDAVDRSLLNIMPLARLSVIGVDRVLSLNEPLFLYTQGGPWSWLLIHLSRERVPLSLVATDGHHILWRADLSRTAP